MGAQETMITQGQESCLHTPVWGVEGELTTGKQLTRVFNGLVEENTTEDTAMSTTGALLWPCVYYMGYMIWPCSIYRAILTTGPSYLPKCTLCNGINFKQPKFQTALARVLDELERN